MHILEVFPSVLSGRTLHGDVRRTRVDGRDLASTYVLCPSQPRCPKFWGNGVHGVYEGIPEYTREDGEDRED